MKKPFPVTRLYLEVKTKNSSDENILIVLVIQSHCVTSDPWPLTSDPVGHFKEGVQEKNSHNRSDSFSGINSVGDGRAVEYYFASDARWDIKLTLWDQIFWILIRHYNVTYKYEQTFANMVVSIRPIWTHSAIIEHTNKVLYMEDDDIAVVKGGKLSIHRLNRRAGEDPVRAIQTLQMELQQIMKGQIKKSKRRFC